MAASTTSIHVVKGAPHMAATRVYVPRVGLSHPLLLWETP